MSTVGAMSPQCNYWYVYPISKVESIAKKYDLSWHSYQNYSLHILTTTDKRFSSSS